MSEKNDTALAPDNVLEQLMSLLGLHSDVAGASAMVQTGLVPMEDPNAASAEARFLSGLAATVLNVEPRGGRYDKGAMFEVVSKIDRLINEQVNEILHNPTFQQVEGTWRGLEDLVSNINFSADIKLDILDVSYDELYEDFENNSSDIFGGALFDKVYAAEYDQYGGQPFGAILGDFQFSNTPRDLFWLRSMAKVAAASHSPFISAVSPMFFGCKSVTEFESIRNLEGIVNHPKYGSWNSFRETEESAYIGLTMPRYILRRPWHPDTNPAPRMNFTEIANGASSNYLWGNSCWLFARNLARSFAQAGWCQYIRGPKAGGLIAGLPVDVFNIRGENELMVPVETIIPDYRELELAKSGFIPLVYRKASADATFFSCQSVKAPKKLKDPKDAENSQLVTNLSYTFSITRIAHYVKSIMRDNIGSTADAPYIQGVLSEWVNQYVTKTVNPDDLTLRAFPFKAAEITVEPKPGQIGWYKSIISVLPHLQFEGMDVELRLESRLG